MTSVLNSHAEIRMFPLENVGMEHFGILEICGSIFSQMKWYLMKHVRLGKINISQCQLIGNKFRDRFLAGN